MNEILSLSNSPAFWFQYLLVPVFAYLLGELVKPYFLRLSKLGWRWLDVIISGYIIVTLISCAANLYINPNQEVLPALDAPLVQAIFYATCYGWGPASMIFFAFYSPELPHRLYNPLPIKIAFATVYLLSTVIFGWAALKEPGDWKAALNAYSVLITLWTFHAGAVAALCYYAVRWALRALRRAPQ